MSSTGKGDEDRDLSGYRLDQEKTSSISDNCSKNSGEQKISVNIQSTKQLIDLDKSIPIEVDSFTKLTEVWNDSKNLVKTSGKHLNFILKMYINCICKKIERLLCQFTFKLKLSNADHSCSYNK